MRAPDVRSEIPSLNRAVGGPFDGKRQLERGPALTSLDLSEHRTAIANRPSQLAKIDPVPIRHGLPLSPEKIGTDCPYVKDKSSPLGTTRHNGQRVPMGHAVGMTTWFNLPRFRQRLEEFRDRTGKTNADVAAAMGIKPDTFSKYLYNNAKRQFSMEQLMGASALFECSVYEFILDSANTCRNEGLTSLSDKAKFFAQLILEKYRSSDISDEDREILYEDFVRNEQRIREIGQRKTRVIDKNNRASGDSCNRN